MNRPPDSPVAKILNTGLALIAKHGLGALTHRRVADEAGMSHGAVSHYFRTKEALINAMFEYHLGTVESMADEVGRDAANVRPSGLLEFILEIVERDLRSKMNIAIDLEIALQSYRSATPPEQIGAWNQTVQLYLAAVLEKGGCVRPVIGAKALLGMIQAFEQQSLIDATLTTQDLKDWLVPLFVGLMPGVDQILSQSSE